MWHYICFELSNQVKGAREQIATSESVTSTFLNQLRHARPGKGEPCHRPDLRTRVLLWGQQLRKRPWVSIRINVRIIYVCVTCPQRLIVPETSYRVVRWTSRKRNHGWGYRQDSTPSNCSQETRPLKDMWGNAPGTTGREKLWAITLRFPNSYVLILVQMLQYNYRTMELIQPDTSFVRFIKRPKILT